MKAEEIVKKYGADKEHSKTVADLSLIFFNKLKKIFVRLQNYDNKNDLNLLYKGALLHDIGINFEDIYKLSHNKAGAKFIYENTPDDIQEEDAAVLACLIKYHRKSLPDEKYEFYKMLNQKQRAKVNFLGAIIKLADAFDCLHINLIENFELEYDKELNVLTLILGDNIMLNKSVTQAIERKKDFFEAVYFTKIKIKGVKSV